MSLPDPFRVAIISDIHYGSPAEAARGHTFLNRIQHPLRRWLVKQQRHWIWLREPWAHNHLLDRFIAGFMRLLHGVNGPCLSCGPTHH